MKIVSVIVFSSMSVYCRSENCASLQPRPYPDECISRCIKTLHDERICSICAFDLNIEEHQERNLEEAITLLSEVCSGSDQLTKHLLSQCITLSPCILCRMCGKSNCEWWPYSSWYREYITQVLESFELGWCIGALRMHDQVLIDELIFVFAFIKSNFFRRRKTRSPQWGMHGANEFEDQNLPGQLCIY